MIKIDLKGQVKEFESGVTPADVAKSIGMGPVQVRLRRQDRRPGL